MTAKTKAFELRSTDRENFFNLYVNGIWKGLVETSKAEKRQTNFRVHSGRKNWTDFVGTKKSFEAHVKETYK